jgi:molybdate transport system ATP-binding protein
MTIEIDVRHRQGGFLLDASFSVDNGTVALFGPSGAGKTTLVNAVAGLVRPDRGRVVVDGTILLDTTRGVDIAPYRRRIGYIFQDGRLFPHLTVRQNLSYGRWFSEVVARAGPMERVVEMLGIGHILARYPQGLSGGEKQRVAIGRALLSGPRLMLMDEPLSSLDEQRKEEILPYIERLRDETGIPIILVSHSVSEVARLATSVVLLAEGRVRAVGAPSQVLQNVEVTKLTGNPLDRSVIEARVTRHDEGADVTTLMSAAGTWIVRRIDAPLDATVRIVVDPTDVILAKEEPRAVSALNCFSGRITGLRDRGTLLDVDVDCGGDLITSRITQFSAQRLGLSKGEGIHILIKAVALDKRAGAAGFGKSAGPGGGVSE